MIHQAPRDLAVLRESMELFVKYADGFVVKNPNGITVKLSGYHANERYEARCDIESSGEFHYFGSILRAFGATESEAKANLRFLIDRMIANLSIRQSEIEKAK